MASIVGFQGMRVRKLCVAALLLVVCHLLPSCHGFSSLQPRFGVDQSSWKAAFASVESTTSLFGTLDDEDDEGDNSSNNQDIDVERERKRLESLLGGSSQGGSNNTIVTASNASNKADFTTLPLAEWKKEVRNPPLLTSIGRERMETEITLLESLATSDDAIPELWNLWYNARGHQAAQELMKTEALVAKGQPDAWKEAEALLRKLISEQGIHFVEPVNRLATLMFLQSQHEESKELCELVLQLKPWHFGALSGMVMVHQGLQDQEGMLEYARQRMPPLPRKREETKEPPPELVADAPLETRQQWVDRMLDLARAILLKQEMSLEESFLDLDKDNSDDATATKGNTATGSTTDKEAPTNSVQKDEPSAKPGNEEDEDEEDAWQ